MELYFTFTILIEGIGFFCHLSNREHNIPFFLLLASDQCDQYLKAISGFKWSFLRVFEPERRFQVSLITIFQNQPFQLFSQHLYTMVAKFEWKEIHNRKVSATPFWDKAKVNIFTNLMNGGKSMKSNLKVKVLPAALYYYRKWLDSVNYHDR